MVTSYPSWIRRIVWPVLAGAAVFVVTPGAADGVDAQQPTFRSAVDLIAVDVQVVDKNGTPIGALEPADFEVSISGRKRRVVSVDFIRSAEADAAPTARAVTSGPMATNLWVGTNPGASRTYVLAFDTYSFGISESRDVVGAARGFIRRLQPDDKIGLYTFPTGPRLEPTTDHVAISQLVNTIVGRTQTMPGEFNLSPSEIVDITAEYSRRSSQLPAQAGPANRTMVPIGDSVLQNVQLRECGGLDSACGEMIQAEASAKAFYLEGRATEGINGLRALIQLLNTQPGRKTVVMFSAGIPISDRPGGRPDVGDLAKQLGQDAAATNTAIYTLHVDQRILQAIRPEQRRIVRTPGTPERDAAVSGRLLEQFSGASGGAFMPVLMGGGELQLDRVLRETSSHYLLGVEPADADRDGKLRELRVKVSKSGTTVRSRSWVVIPKKQA
jgi:VWFA-related protein